MNTLRTTLVVLVALVALIAVACGDSSEETVVEPTPEPTVAPTPIPPTPEPTPVTPMPEPQTETGTGDTQTDAMVMTFDVPEFGPETTGMDVAEALLSPAEIACVQSTLGPEASAALLAANVLDPTMAGTTDVFGECLTQENSVTLFLAGLQGVAGGTLSEETLNCAGNAAAPYHTDLFAEETPPAVTFGVLPCLSPEEMEALLSAAPQ